MSESNASAAEHLLFDDIRSKLEDMLGESGEKHSVTLTPEELELILEKLEAEISREG